MTTSTSAPPERPTARASVSAPRAPASRDAPRGLRPDDGGPATAPPVRRDVALDLVRGLAMVILVINHLRLPSALAYATEPFLSAAEALVSVSGVVVGIVFGRRWLTDGRRATTLALLRRAGKLYIGSVVVVAIVGALTAVPWLATEALAVPPGAGGPGSYAFDGPATAVVAILTLEAGPWQFNIMGFFIAALAVAPAILWALERGWWPLVLAVSWIAFFGGRATMVDLLPAQSEGPFPFLIWQLLFVHGGVLGWHRDPVRSILRRARRARRTVISAIVVSAAAAAYLRLHEIGLDPLGLDRLLGFSAEDWRRWDAEHFDKPTLDAARLVTMISFTAAIYLGLRRVEPLAERTIGRLLLPLGRNSFYVFIMHAFLALAVASVPVVGAGGIGLAGNTVVQLASLAALWVMVRRRFLFRWVPH